MLVIIIDVYLEYQLLSITINALLTDSDTKVIILQMTCHELLHFVLHKLQSKSL